MIIIIINISFFIFFNLFIICRYLLKEISRNVIWSGHKTQTQCFDSAGKQCPAHGPDIHHFFSAYPLATPEPQKYWLRLNCPQTVADGFPEIACKILKGIKYNAYFLSILIVKLVNFVDCFGIVFFQLFGFVIYLWLCSLR